MSLGALLVWAGCAKVLRPDVAASLMPTGRLGSTWRRLMIRIIGAAEIIGGLLAVLFLGWQLAAALALAYAFFSLFSLYAITRLDLASCGCFGGVETPPNWAHFAVTCIATVVAVGAAASNSPGLTTLIGGASPTRMAIVLVDLLLATIAWYELAVSLPRLLAAIGTSISTKGAYR